MKKTSVDHINGWHYVDLVGISVSFADRCSRTRARILMFHHPLQWQSILHMETLPEKNKFTLMQKQFRRQLWIVQDLPNTEPDGNVRLDSPQFSLKGISTEQHGYMNIHE